MANYPIAVWWQNISNIDTWVKTRGVNVLIYNSAISFQKGDFLALHQKVESLRQQGYPLWVIRAPAYKFVSDPQPVSFDIQWQSHLLAFALDDEFEDKVTGSSPGPFGNQQLITTYAQGEIAKYKAWLPGTKIFANFNGTHVSSTDGGLSQKLYTNLAALGIDYLCHDIYPICNQQHKPDGSLLYPDPIATITTATKLLKQWTGKPVWTFLETCNQGTNKAGAAGWAAPWIFNGSREPTPAELENMYTGIRAVAGDGIAYFPQAGGGTVNDATAADLVPALQAIALAANPAPVPPAPADPLAGSILTSASGKVYKLVAQ